ncbi:MAG TPA: hypothetical protein VGB87_01760 [Vicinamibacteria bacterium]|jgi:hypothetical protein
MVRDGRKATTSAVRIRALAPLTSGEEEGRYWYDAGDRGAGSFAWDSAGLVYWFDCFGCDNDGTDIAWSCVDLRSGH